MQQGPTLGVACLAITEHLLPKDGSATYTCETTKGIQKDRWMQIPRKIWNLISLKMYRSLTNLKCRKCLVSSVFVCAFVLGPHCIIPTYQRGGESINYFRGSSDDLDDASQAPSRLALQHARSSNCSCTAKPASHGVDPGHGPTRRV